MSLLLFYNHYVPKIFKIKKPSAEVKILILINYMTICCQIQEYDIHRIIVGPTRLSLVLRIWERFSKVITLKI